MKNIKLNNVDFVETLIEKIREKFCNEDFIPKIISTVYEDILATQSLLTLRYCKFVNSQFTVFSSLKK
jgi:hypothetical protein